MSERGLAADEDHFARVELVFLEKLDNLFLHEEMVGGSLEPGQPPQFFFWEPYCFFKMELVIFLNFVVNHICIIEDLCWYFKNECNGILVPGKMLGMCPPLVQYIYSIRTSNFSDLDGIQVLPMIRHF